MKYLIVLVLWNGIVFQTQAQSNLHTTGAVLYIGPGSSLQIGGSFSNEAGSKLVNDGHLSVSGNITNHSQLSAFGSGSLSLKGTAAQMINGSAPLLVNDLTVDNSAGITLGTSLKINGELGFINGITDAINVLAPVIFTANGAVHPGNPPTDAAHINGYVATEGTGPFTYPTGDGIRYQPVTVDLSVNSSALTARYYPSDAGSAPYSANGTDPVLLLSRNASEYWDISPSGNAEGSVTLYWDAYQNTGIHHIDDLRVGHLSGGSWLNEGAVSASGTTSSGSVSSNNISTWSPFTIGSISLSNPLPVSLLSFTVLPVEENSVLNWEVAEALNFSHFEVERSTDGKNFESIATVSYSDGITNYRLTDTGTSSKKLLYYRLKMKDTDNTYAYSQIASVMFEKTPVPGFTAYPNPVRETLEISLNDNTLTEISAVITSVNGITLQQQKLQVRNGKSLLPVNGLTDGIYILSLKDESGTYSVKFIKTQ